MASSVREISYFRIIWLLHRSPTACIRERVRAKTIVNNSMNHNESTATMGVFLDLENLVHGAKDAEFPDFDIRKVLERLFAKGTIVVKRAYCDFSRYRDFKRNLHEAAFELIEIPHLNQSGKNSADIRMVVDALSICYTNSHINTFVIVSGDSDFSPLVSKLRENAKTVIGVGVKRSTSDLFRSNCDEFIYYDDLVRHELAKKRNDATPPAPSPKPATAAKPPQSVPPSTKAADSKPQPKPATPKPAEKKPQFISVEKAMAELMSTLELLRTEKGADEVFHAGGIKSTIKRRNPGFDERAHGFKSFSELLKEAERRSLITLKADEQGSLRIVPDEPAHPATE